MKIDGFLQEEDGESSREESKEKAIVGGIENDECS